MNRPWVHSLNDGTPMCVGDTILVVLSYKFQLFSLTEVCLRVSYELFCISCTLCMVGLFAVILQIVLLAAWSGLIDRLCFIFDFQLNLYMFFFKIILLYSSFFNFPAIKLPSLPSVYYLLCDQVIYITFVHYIIRYLMEF